MYAVRQRRACLEIYFTHRYVSAIDIIYHDLERKRYRICIQLRVTGNDQVIIYPIKARRLTGPAQKIGGKESAIHSGGIVTISAFIIKIAIEGIISQQAFGKVRLTGRISGWCITGLTLFAFFLTGKKS